VSRRPLPQLLRIAEAAARLGLSRTSVYDLIAAGHLPSVHLDVGGTRVREDDLAAYVERCTDRSRRTA